MKCGLLGQKLGHSYSPEIHRYLGSYDYTLFEKEPEALRDFLTADSFDGINVTIPYKKAVIPFCSRLSPEAERLGAVNTIVRSGDGTLIGHNTDFFGFQSMLKHAGLQPENKKVLVLGSGGASNTVCAVLKDMGAHTVIISRRGVNNYENISLHQDASIIVNTTPVGMYPNNGASPLSIAQLPNLEGVLDLIYNPAKTALLLEAEKRNLVTENGLWMLIAQAKESAQWFTGQAISDACIHTIYSSLKKQMHNIILIGMPGCGKSTVGKILARKLNREFVDADLFLEAETGMTVPEILQSKGENEFRRLETQVLSQLGKRSGLVIATGGGCVTRQENYSLLHQNGLVIWIKRPLQQLATEGRPLSQATAAADMYAVRQPMYQAFSHYEIDNTASADAAAEQILQALQGR